MQSAKGNAKGSPKEILSDIWTSAGGDVSALDAVTLTGDEPQLPSSFRVAAAAQVSVAATGLAAAQIWQLRSGQSQDVAVDMRHAVVECRSERYLRVDGKPPPPTWDVIAGVYKTRDQRFVRLHTNFRHHRDAVCKLLNCKPERDEVQAALLQWDGEAFETAAYAGGCVVALMRSHDDWSATPHAKALAELPLISIEKIGDAAPKPWPGPGRSAAGRHSRARSVACDRGAGRGPHARRPRRRCAADLRSGFAGDPLAHHRHRPRQAHEFCRTQERAGPQHIARSAGAGGYFFAGLSAARDRRPRVFPEGGRAINPGIVYVTLSAYGHAGPWAERRGFDSLVQTATGFNHAEGKAAGVDGPKELPAQMLDHATGYFMAFGAMMAKARQAREGGSWHVRVSLAQTGRWLWNLGRVDDGFVTADLKGETVMPFIEEVASGFGPLRSVRIPRFCRKRPRSGPGRRCRSAVIRRNGRRAVEVRALVSPNFNDKH